MFRPSSLSVAIGVALIAFSLLSQSAIAATITVTTEEDEIAVDNGECALREAIVNANNDDDSGSDDCTPGDGDDTIVVPAGNYLLDVGGSGATRGDLDLTTNITIVGAGPTQTVVDGAGLSPRDRVFDVDDGATVTISRLTIQHGLTTGDGGGVRNNEGALTLRDVIVFENTAEDGGGVKNESGQTLTMIRTSIRDNTSTSDGGGLFNQGTASLTDGDISENTAESDGGGARNDGFLTLTRSRVRSNDADDTAGGIENRLNLDLIESTVDDNEAGDDGGGVQSEVEDDNSPVLTIERSAITNNRSGEDGGGIDLDGGIANIRNSTISGNTAAVDGGGLEASDAVAVSLVHVTIANNTAAQGNGIFVDPVDSAGVTVRSTIVANGSSGANCAGFPILSSGTNLEFPGDSCDFDGPGDVVGADPRLGPLANNGGPTPTHALLPGSAAIDTASNANCPATDQRGEPRPADGDGNGSAICDIGAFEVQPAKAAEIRNDPNNDDEKKKETEEQRQQRERTNRSNKSDYATEGNVLAVERLPDGKHLLVTIGLTRSEKLTVQVTCVDLKCPDIRVGDYLEADGYQNGVGDPNDYFIAEDITVRRGGKKVN
jgi:hypothetical protein